MSSNQPGTASSGTPSGWAARVLPLALLILLALAGLRGAVATPRWTALERSRGTAMCCVLMVVLIALLVILLRRRRGARTTAAGDTAPTDTATKLRGVLLAVLSAAIVADFVAILYGLHLKLPAGKLRPAPQPRPSGHPRVPRTITARPSAGGGSFPLNAVLYAVLVVLLIIAIAFAFRWARRLRPVPRLGDDEPIAEDSADLLEAVESGRSALRTFDDAKTAIIACYLAMEQRLAARGTTRTAADTPDELLARATRTGVVHGGAAQRLTQLFYEARFSSHPMDQGQRTAAEQALDDLAADLAAQAEPAQTGTAQAGTAQTGTAQTGTGTA
jgi:Domain of unknown function (DUF4129)